MATKKHGSSVAALQRTKAALKKKIAAKNKKKNDAKRAEKLKREIATLKSKLGHSSRSRRRR